ncbi:MAG: class I poly(R)-hydroxyalkanoic acid synthase [Alphaproteobacteria bacterium]|nr:class I poly(R)-hydroxyalkanoic acid synthase [Alphaproteobacteria bacterium SS10]
MTEATQKRTRATAAKTGAKTTAKAGAKAAPKTTAKPAAKAAAKPAAKTTRKPAAKTAAKPAAKKPAAVKKPTTANATTRKPAAKKPAQTKAAAAKKATAKTTTTKASQPSAAKAKAQAGAKSSSTKSTKTEPPQVKIPDPVELSKSVANIAERSQKLILDFMEKRGQQPDENGALDPLNIGSAFLELTQRMMADPAYLMKAQMSLMQSYVDLWQYTTQRMLGGQAKPVVEPSKGDKRFKDQEWEDNAVFDYIKQSYLLTARWLQDTVHKVDGIDAKQRKKLDFYTRQFVDALAPSNFATTNPAVIRATLESGGENLIDGLENLLRDMERGEGDLIVTMTDKEAFKVGENIAVTPGKVIYENPLAQLIQYEPTTKEVFKKPLLVLPPWINKFYILDLKPENSFIKWAVDQGHTVFVVSWVNPDESLADKSFEDYMRLGVFDMLDQIEKQTGERQVNAAGYCLGGTLLASTLAVMARRGTDDRIASATFFTTLTDFEESGEVAVFVDETQLEHLEDRMADTGYFDAIDMHRIFNMLRANDLIWSFVVNNYLLGKEPIPFDLLYWNSDSTRLPAAMHLFYLRNMYQKNLLIEPDALTLDGTPVDLNQVKTPTYLLSTRDDHIAPWNSTYRATEFYKGDTTFVLAASGHIAGVVNPPAKNKYCYWTNDKLSKSAEDWLEAAEQHDGSWWPHWQQWANQHIGEKVPARDPSKGKLKPIENAPGRYVTVQAF